MKVQIRGRKSVHKMQPRIVKSDLTKPPRWYVVTRYVEKEGIDAKTGEKRAYIVASKKYDVIEQMEAILSQVHAVKSPQERESR